MSKHAVKLYARWEESVRHCRERMQDAMAKGYDASQMLHKGHINALTACQSDLYLWSPPKTKAALRKWIKENIKDTTESKDQTHE